MIVLGFSGIRSGQYFKNTYGVRFVGHDSSAALVRDGHVVFAAEEERFSRSKHTSELPIQTIEWGLRSLGLTLADVDAIAYPWHADLKRLFHMYLHHPTRIPVWHWPALAMAGHEVIRELMSPRRLSRLLESRLGASLPPVHGVAHHATHSACTYFTSPFDESAVLTVDGQGEDESATLGEWQGTNYRRFQGVFSPDSIGILYGMITDFLGMRAAWDEYKVMAMASLGDPARFAPHFNRLVTLLPDGQLRTHRTAMVFKPGYCDRYLAQVFGTPQREDPEPLAQIHFDLAAAMQAKLEETLFHLLHRLRQLSMSRNLCLAGGVFLNSVANGKIRRSGLFENVHVPPVPGDHGAALGAAFATYYKLSGARKQDSTFTPFQGPEYSDREVELALNDHHPSLRFHLSANVVEEAAALLEQNQIIAWFQGRMEYGPRALGHRSILANATNSAMKHLVNERIKHREQFRPFAGAVPIDDAPTYFDIAGESPHMQFVLPVRQHFVDRLAAVTHNGTCRVQTVSNNSDPLFYSLLQAFGRRSGIPIILNTSFNDRDEPIVCSPGDAVRTFLRTDLDALVIGNFVAIKRPESLDRS